MNFTPQQKYSLLSKMGYTGSVDNDSMEQFIQSNPGAAAKMGKFQRALTRGFQTGGLVAPGQTALLGNRDFVGDPSNRPYSVPYVPPAPTPVAPTPVAPTTEEEEEPTPDVFKDQYTAYKPISRSPEEAKKLYKNRSENLINKERKLKSVTPKITTREDGKIEVEGVSTVFDSQEAAEQYLRKNNPTYRQAVFDLNNAQRTFSEATQDLEFAQTQAQALMPSASEVSSQALADPSSLVTQAETERVSTQPGQFVRGDVGVVKGRRPEAQVTTTGPAAEAQAPEATAAATMEATTVTPRVRGAVKDLEAAQGEVSQTIEAAQQTASAVSELEAAQGESIKMDNPVQRQIQEGELISGSAVDAQKVEQMNAQLQAAEATPSEKATVQGQLSDLMQQFEGGKTPAWAAGAMRNAQGILAQRGLGASSMAGQAVIQAAMESALPIAQADANTRAQFESQNLSNRQQVAMFAAQQRAAFLEQEFDQEFQSRVQNASRIADIANMNFTAEQQIALENSRIANTMNLQNLSNRQAMTIAEASALANLELSNLNNRQQAAVQNAQNFLQMDLTNLNNEQQTAIFKSQQRVNALLSDQAAENAAEQFNAASENQTNQFFADLASTTSRFNADQTNAVNQFNAGQENATEQFNANLQEQRDQFNANNRLIVAQANAKWRQDIATLDTAAQNEAIMEAAKAANGLTATAMDEIWQRERDLMNFSFQAAENAQDRYTELLIADKKFETEQILQAQELSAADKAGKGKLWGTIAGAVAPSITKAIFG